jgi:paraquat-inducible protein A
MRGPNRIVASLNGLTLLKLLWWPIAMMLLVGMFAPLFTFKRFLIFNSTVSLISGIVQLFQEDEIFLFTVIGSFSVLLPIYKMALLFRLLYFDGLDSKRRKRNLKLLSFLGKWSMLDVFVVAVLLVTIKMGAVANVETHLGLYAFGVAVLGSMFLTQRAASLLDPCK